MNHENLPENADKRIEPEFGAVIALGKNWRLPITGGPRIDLSLESKMTALAAGQMYRDGKVGKIIFSTGKTAGKNSEGNDYPTEAEEMRRFMRIFFPIDEIPEEDVIVEAESFDTAGNAQEVRHILLKENIKNPALLTVGFHLPRSKKLFANYDVSIKKAFSSEDVLKGRNPHYKKFLSDYFWSKRHIKEIAKETIGVGLVYTIDPKGERLRRITTKTRNREEDTK